VDPQLSELIAEGAPEDETAVVVRLHDMAAPPAGLRIVARFGTVCTARARRGDLARLHADPAIASLKAPRVYSSELEAIHDEPGVDEADPEPKPSDHRRPEGLAETGKGVCVAIIDWGCDYALPDFRNADGSTRLLALWDQRATGRVAPYGYGRIHDRQAIDRALKSKDPFAALGYATTSSPQHGTHVLGIAAGNGRSGGPSGIAPDAGIIFCHLGTRGEDLGSSVEVLEALDFAVKTAGDLSLVVNFSLGRHAGPHDGTLLLERAIDWLITHRPGTAVVQSTGNYYARRVHMCGRLHETKRVKLPFDVPHPQPAAAPVSLELWYPGEDEFTVSVSGPKGARASARRGASSPVKLSDGREVGTLYHRAFDPNNGDHLVNLVLRPADAIEGSWTLEATGVDVVDGRWHAWIERDAACRDCQAQFPAKAARPTTSTGSVVNAMRTIAVGAWDSSDPDHEPVMAEFSSVGPTRDGRTKPLLAAPGVRVLSCRSRLDAAMTPGYVRMSGTSMAAPHVTGAMALMLQAAGPQPIAVLRRTLFSTLDPSGDDGPRWGYGRLAIAAAVAAARKLSGKPIPAGPDARPQSAPHEIDEIANAPEAAEAPEADEAVPVVAEAREAGDAADVAEAFIAGAEPVDDALAYLRRALDAEDRDFALLAAAGQPLAAPLRVGDLVLDLGGGEIGIVSDKRIYGREEAGALGLTPIGPWPGGYVRLVAEDGGASPFVRRVVGPDALVAPELALVRPSPELDEAVFGEAPGQDLLRRGSSGPAVLLLQMKLNEIHGAYLLHGSPGLDRCPLVPDGRFGDATAAAVRSFQVGAFPFLPNEWDGIVGPKTRAKLDAWSLADLVPLVPLPNPPPFPSFPNLLGQLGIPPAPEGGRDTVIPVILLPGVMGTRLTFPKANLPDWDPDATVGMLKWFGASGADKMAGLAFNSRADIIADSKDPVRHERGWDKIARANYQPLIDAIEAEFSFPPQIPAIGPPRLRCPVWVFAYDWRQSNYTHAQGLDAFVSSVLERERAEQVILITHSMGGLVARAALQAMPKLKGKVKGVIHTVIPSCGAVVAARRFRTGFDRKIDGSLGEVMVEMLQEGLGVEADLAAADDEGAAAAKFATNWLFQAIFSDSTFSASPEFYNRLMSVVRGPVELLPSDAAPKAWWPPLAKEPLGTSVWEVYGRTWPKGGLVHPSVAPTADGANLLTRFTEAHAFHDRIAGQYHPVTGLVLSTGFTTDVMLDPEKRPKEGDGTVPEFSARCPDLQQPHFTAVINRAEHSTCFKNADFLEATLDGLALIARGGAATGSKAPPKRKPVLITI
jgi:subtilisin family serine protease